jgi:glycosyltransferase involved in cell wall biosynthesis
MNRILIFNFFAGVMNRGIPVYARELGICVRHVGFEVVELTCPKWLRRAPRPIHNLMFVLFEQIIAPFMRVTRGCALTVYPYNSSSIVDALIGKSIVVVHDLISNERDNARFAAKYVRVTQTIHRVLRRPVCAASVHTLKQLRRLTAFERCDLQLWSNPFYSFDAALKRAGTQAGAAYPARPRVLLCSGMGPNKDFAGALKLFSTSEALRECELRIVGFGDDAHLAERRVNHLPLQIRERVSVRPRLALDELASEIATSDLVWVHSSKEGFGRPVLEALLANRPVVASDIGAFRALRHPGLYLYRENEFDSAVLLAWSGAEAVDDSFIHAYHDTIESNVREVLTSALNHNPRCVMAPPEPGALIRTSASELTRGARVSD